MPACINSGTALIIAVIMPSIICGIASTIAVMISGSAPISAVNNCIPASTIWGIAEIMNVVTAAIITAIVEAIPQIIDGIITAIIGAVPLLIQAGIDLLTALIGALPAIVRQLLKLSRR